MLFPDIQLISKPKKALEFAATATVFKCDLAQHVAVVSKRCRFFTLVTLIKMLQRISFVTFIILSFTSQSTKPTDNGN